MPLPASLGVVSAAGVHGSEDATWDEFCQRACREPWIQMESISSTQAAWDLCPRCLLCKKWLNGDADMNAHLSSKAHMQMLARDPPIHSSARECPHVFSPSADSGEPVAAQAQPYETLPSAIRTELHPAIYQDHAQNVASPHAEHIRLALLDGGSQALCVAHHTCVEAIGCWHGADHELRMDLQDLGIESSPLLNDLTGHVLCKDDSSLRDNVWATVEDSIHRSQHVMLISITVDNKLLRAFGLGGNYKVRTRAAKAALAVSLGLQQ